MNSVQRWSDSTTTPAWWLRRDHAQWASTVSASKQERRSACRFRTAHLTRCGSSAGPAAVVIEAVRVLKPGGRLVAVEPDLEALLLDSAMPQTTATIVGLSANGYANPGRGVGYVV